MSTTFSVDDISGTINLIANTAVTNASRNYDGAGGSQYIGRKSRGSVASQSAVQANDTLFSIFAKGCYGASYLTASSIVTTVIEPTPSATAMGGRLALGVTPLGATAPTEVLRIEADSGLSLYGANPFVDQNRVIHRRVFATLSDLTTLVTSPVAGMEAAIQDADSPAWGAAALGGGGQYANVTYNGTVWVCG